MRHRLALACLPALSWCALASAAPTPAADAGARPESQHAFDFELGSWKIHLRKRRDPLTGSNTWIAFDGTSVTRKVWDGRAQLEEFETDGAGGRIEGLTLRLYNPNTRQWSLYWANSKDGILDPPQVGEFKTAQGEFYGWQSLGGRPILVRFIWSRTATDSPHFEQSFSNDGGKTWEVNWITDQSRAADVPGMSGGPPASPPIPQAATTGANLAPAQGQHDFDPLIGRWKYHLKRRVHPLSGSNTWVEFSGTGVCAPVWNGRANLEEAEFDAPAGHIEGLVLRLYDPKSRQWRLYWANSKDGTVVSPQIGEFRDGRGNFYAQDLLDGKSILVRYEWSNLMTDTPHFEQAFSDDGGKTWEVNWITDQTRMVDTSVRP